MKTFPLPELNELHFSRDGAESYSQFRLNPLTSH